MFYYSYYYFFWKNYSLEGEEYNETVSGFLFEELIKF